MPEVNTGQVIKDAREELKARVVSRGQNDRRIAELRIMLRTLARFANDELRDQILQEVKLAKRTAPSLTSAIFDSLMRHPQGMTSNQIRDDLEQTGFDLEEYSQPLGTIMATLNRLVEAGNVKRRLNKDKSVIFRAKDFDEEAK